jgi:ring-1,2-phenylacetyl-CoA epoxidase subunit PaaD
VVTRAVELDAVEQVVWEALAEVHDPEIPPCSITDLGIVEGIQVTNDNVEVELLPTFAGCPALDVIRDDAEAAVRTAVPGRQVSVRFVYSKPWTSDRITSHGRQALREYGVTPPGDDRLGGVVMIPLAVLQRTSASAQCPFCGSEDTEMESAFGPTLCRSTHFCRSCRNPFEAFKPKTIG